MKTIHIYSCMLCVILAPSIQANVFNAFDKVHHGMLELMDKMHDDMDELFTSIATSDGRGDIAVNFDQSDDDSVCIELKDVSTDSIKASFDDKELSIVLPDATANLRVLNDNILSISLLQEITCEEKSKDGEVKSVSQRVNKTGFQEYLNVPIELEKATLEYNKQDKLLTILLPKVRTKKNIPVNIIE